MMIISKEGNIVLKMSTTSYSIERFVSPPPPHTHTHIHLQCSLAAVVPVYAGFLYKPAHFHGPVQIPFINYDLHLPNPASVYSGYRLSFQTKTKGTDVINS